MMSELRIVFAGTPEFAAAHLNSILNSSHEVLDTGDMLLKSEVSIDGSDTRNDLESKLTEVGC